jgi:hypothetical protein
VHVGSVWQTCECHTGDVGHCLRPAPFRALRVFYAVKANEGSTGTDSKVPGGGFVSTSGRHHSWRTPNRNAARQEGNSTHLATLKSDSEAPVNITVVDVHALHGTVTVKSTICMAKIQVVMCGILVTCDSTRQTSPTGHVHDAIGVNLQSLSGDGQVFIQNAALPVPRNSGE